MTESLLYFVASVPELKKTFTDLFIAVMDIGQAIEREDVVDEAEKILDTLDEQVVIVD